MKIELSEAQVKKFEEWKNTFRDKKGHLPQIGATGGHFGLKIIFTSIDEVIYGIAWNGEQIDLTEWGKM